MFFCIAVDAFKEHYVGELQSLQRALSFWSVRQLQNVLIFSKWTGIGPHWYCGDANALWRYFFPCKSFYRTNIQSIKVLLIFLSGLFHIHFISYFEHNLKDKCTLYLVNKGRSTIPAGTHFYRAWTSLSTKPQSHSIPMLLPDLLVSPGFIDPVNIIVHKVTVFNCLCFLSWGRIAALLGGSEILSCDIKPCPSERVLTLFNTSAIYIYIYTYILRASHKWNGLHYAWTIGPTEACTAADSWK